MRPSHDPHSNLIHWGGYSTGFRTYRELLGNGGDVMTKAALAILICELISIHFLLKKYFGKSSGIEIEEFLSRASLDDVLRMRHHAISGFLAMCVMTMGKLFDR